MFKLQFDQKEIINWSKLYPIAYDYEVDKIDASLVCNRGYFTKQEFVTICLWKTPCSKSEVESNEERKIISLTRNVFSTPDEQRRIDVLNLLDGVNWSTSSALLHFGFPDTYPILDYQRLRSLGREISPKSYNFERWWQYTQFCKQLATKAKVTMRVLDRALLQYSKEN